MRKKKEKKNNIPSVDLSAYKGKTISAKVERIIINLLIITEGDIKEVAKRTKLDKDDINRVYLTHYVAIENLKSLDQSTSRITTTLNKIVEMESDHIDAVKKQLDASNTKLMNDKLVRNLNQIADKLIQLNSSNKTIKANAIKETMKDIINCKALEIEERIKLPDEVTSDYKANSDSVFSRLLNYTEDTQIEGKEYDHTNTSKKAIIENLETGEKKIYKSLKALSADLNMDQRRVGEYIKTDGIFNGKYKIRYLDDED